MQPEQERLARELLTGVRVATVALLVDGAPHAGLMPFVFEPAEAALLVHVSGLARHSRGLSDGAPFSALIHAPDRPEADPLQLPRLTVTGSVRSIERSHPRFAAASGLYRDRFPSSRPTFQLADFRLVALVAAGARLVAGFASTANLTPGALRQLVSP